MDTIDTYKARKTLIVGDTNTGKTARTIEILQLFLTAGLGAQTTVIDMAPDVIGGVGGKMPVPRMKGFRYLTETIVAPRLTAADENQAQALAQANARAIAKLLDCFSVQPSDILFVNDASLYLQAGDLAHFLAVLNKAETVVLNAYFGDSFPDSMITRREKRLVRRLIENCDYTIVTSPNCL